MRILRGAEIPGVQIREVCRKHNITEQTFFRWRNKYGGMDVPDARRLKNLESENARSKKLVAEQGAGERRVEGVIAGNMTSPIGRRRLLKLDQGRGLSARGVPAVGVESHGGLHQLQQPEKDRPHAQRLIATSQQFPRFGYRRMAVWL